MKFFAFASLMFVASALWALPSLADSNAAGRRLEVRELARAIEHELVARQEAADLLGQSLSNRELDELQADLYARFLNNMQEAAGEDFRDMNKELGTELGKAGSEISDDLRGAGRVMNKGLGDADSVLKNEAHKFHDYVNQ